MASLKKKELRKKRLARKKAGEARVKDIKAIEAELAKSVETFDENIQPLELLENKGHCQKCHRKGFGGGLQKVSTLSLQHHSPRLPFCFLPFRCFVPSLYAHSLTTPLVSIRIAC
jgi:hypothetical protein